MLDAEEVSKLMHVFETVQDFKKHTFAVSPTMCQTIQIVNVSLCLKLSSGLFSLVSIWHFVAEEANAATKN